MALDILALAAMICLFVVAWRDFYADQVFAVICGGVGTLILITLVARHFVEIAA